MSCSYELQKLSFTVPNSECQIREAEGQTDRDIFLFLRSGGATPKLPLLLLFELEQNSVAVYVNAKLRRPLHFCTVTFFF